MKEARAKRARNHRPGRRLLAFGEAWDYAPSLEDLDDVPIDAKWDLYIGGRWRAPRGGRYFAARNPVQGSVVARVAEAGALDVDDALRAARVAYRDVWSKMSGAERAKCVFRCARAVEENARELSVVESMNSARPVQSCRDFDLPLAAAHFFYYAGWADKLSLAFHGRPWRPLGVIAEVIESGPALLTAARKLAPALASGNTVVLRPLEEAPLATLMLVRILAGCGLPGGAVNVVTGGVATAKALAAHRRVDDGALASARDARAARGRAHVIFADAPIDQAVDAIVDGMLLDPQAWRSPGGGLLVEESVEARVTRKLRDRMATLRIGSPLDRNTDVGAPGPKARSGRAPQLTVQTFRTAEEAVAKANGAPSGVAIGVWTDKGAKALWMARRLRAGIVWANTHARFDPCAPWSGLTEGGSGGDGGPRGLYPYVKLS
ncbi:MAG: aldehyde dehydrogenase family protein [Polyangiaceae bacterium]